MDRKRCLFCLLATLVFASQGAAQARFGNAIVGSRGVFPVGHIGQGEWGARFRGSLFPLDQAACGGDRRMLGISASSPKVSAGFLPHSMMSTEGVENCSPPVVATAACATSGTARGRIGRGTDVRN